MPEAEHATPRIGTAGWSLPAATAELFDREGTYLERYASRLSAVEINSSFHRPHRRTTYERWAASVPPRFRFSVKLPRTISHAPPDRDHDALIGRFAAEIAGLGETLGAVLVQFPPRRPYDRQEAGALFARLAGAIPCALVCEPRHPSWFTADAEAFLHDRRVARAAADPAIAPGADEPGGWPALRYHRLHGSPRIYRSSYEAAELARLAETLAAGIAAGVETWCVFDNTAAGAATDNAISVAGLLSPTSGHPGLSREAGRVRT